jgi:Protein of unknown function (DUF2946)
MRWFRDHVRLGSWLALVAIAINFGMAFGHVHAVDGTGYQRELAALVAATTSGGSDQGRNHPTDRADYLCPICAAAAAMGSAVAPTPPALPVEFADVTIDHAIEHVVAAPRAPPAAFQSRGPPIS